MLFLCHSRMFFFVFISFPDVYTQLRVALEKQRVQVRRIIHIPNVFKPWPDGTVATPVPNLSDFEYHSTKYSCGLLVEIYVRF